MTFGFIFVSVFGAVSIAVEAAGCGDNSLAGAINGVVRCLLESAGSDIVEFGQNVTRKEVGRKDR